VSLNPRMAKKENKMWISREDGIKVEMNFSQWQQQIKWYDYIYLTNHSPTTTNHSLFNLLPLTRLKVVLFKFQTAHFKRQIQYLSFLRWQGGWLKKARFTKTKSSHMQWASSSLPSQTKQNKTKLSLICLVFWRLKLWTVFHHIPWFLQYR
jgi:hypothetical protein